MNRAKRMTIDSWITDHARTTPNKAALNFGGETITYAEFETRIAEKAAELTGAGIVKGDRIAWYGLNHPEVFVLLFACARIGAMLLPLNWRLAEGEIVEITTNATPKLIIHDSHFAEQAQTLGIPTHAVGTQIAPPATTNYQASLEDALLLVYTSGSTGRPKGVVLAQKALVANAQMSIECHNLIPSDTALNVLPLFHVGGLNILPTPAFSIGATVELHEKFDPLAMLNALQRINHAITVPTVLQAVITLPGWETAELSNLRGLSIGSTDVPVELIEQVQKRGIPVMQVYGATETSPFAIYQTQQEAVATTGTLGRIGCACDIRLVDNGMDVADGEPGEIWVKGDNVMAEYWNAPELTETALIDGWFRTGDVAIRDEDGVYRFADRIKHVIISGGENIYPAEIERVLRRHPDIAEVSVVGRYDEKWGEVPVAVIVSNAPPALDQIHDYLDGKIANYKRPRHVVFTKTLPRNTMGKIIVDDVRKIAQAATSPQTA